MKGLFEGGWREDLRFGWRGLRRNPGFAVVAVVTLALGVGGNTAVFSVVDAVLIEPLPFPEPEELVAIHETRLGNSWWAAAANNALAWRERSRTLEDVAWAQQLRMGLTVPDGDPEAISVVTASANILRLLKVPPALGRDFQPGEDLAGREAVALLTHKSWRDRFGADPSMVGRRIELDGNPFSVVGVLPPGAAPTFMGDHEVLIPRVVTEAELQTRGRIFRAVGRIAEGATLQAAEAEMAELGAVLDDEAPAGSGRGWGVRLVPLKEEVVGSATTPLLVLLGAVGFVLLVACANLSNLMLARGSARKADLAVRASLGAGRGRLSRHLLAEALLIGALGGAAGLALAVWGTDVLLAVDPTALPRLDGVEPDLRVLVFTGAISMLAAGIFGLIPALRLSRIDLASTFRGSTAGAGGGRGEARARSGLVVAEVALVVLLLVGAGIMLRSVQALTSVDPGFDVEERVALRFSIPKSRYPDPASRSDFSRRLMQKVQTVPGVVAAGTVTTLPLSGGPGYTSFQVLRSLPEPAVGAEPIGGMEVVTPGYFEAMGIPLLDGRDFREADLDADRLVVIVDDGVTASIPGGVAPLSEAIRIAPPNAGPAADWRDIVGVVGQVRYGLDTDPRPRMYLPEGHVPFGFAPRTLVARIGAGQEAAAIEGLRAAFQEIDPALPIERVEWMEDVAYESIARSRFQSLLLLVFASIALGLGAVGVYGVVAYSVTRRTREVGVRIALGASRSEVLETVLRSALTPIALGMGIGLLAAAALSEFVAAVAYGVEPLDPVSFAAGPALLAVVAAVAILVPAMRASRIDPVRALREE